MRVILDLFMQKLCALECPLQQNGIFFDLSQFATLSDCSDESDSLWCSDDILPVLAKAVLNEVPLAFAGPFEDQLEDSTAHLFDHILEQKWFDGGKVLYCSLGPPLRRQ